MLDFVLIPMWARKEGRMDAPLKSNHFLETVDENSGEILEIICNLVSRLPT